MLQPTLQYPITSSEGRSGNTQDLCQTTIYQTATSVSIVRVLIYLGLDNSLPMTPFRGTSIEVV